MGQDSFKSVINFKNLGIILGLFFFCREIYSFVVFSFGAQPHLPSFLYFPANHVNLCMLFLSCWIIAFSHYSTTGNTRALLTLFFLFGVVLLATSFGTRMFVWESLFFYVPKGFSQIIMHIDLTLFLWIPVRLAWFDIE